MKDIFDQLSERCSQMITQRYSTSFSLGIRFLDSKFHKPIYGIYGFVRCADEIVDSFKGYNREYLLRKFRKDTVEAIQQRISLNPLLNSFQQVVRDYGVEYELIDTFLQSMKMDIEMSRYDQRSYQRYILGSAEVVGLMCLRVFTEGDHQLYEKLKPYAMRLGAAFQKVNFLRDAKDDFEALGRTYFPGVNLSRFSVTDKEKIEAEIQLDFKEGLEGIRMLPVSSRKGVYLAYLYYQNLLDKIRRTPAQKILTERIRIPNGQKLGIMFHSFIRHQLNLM